MFSRMLDHRRIHVELAVDFFAIQQKVRASRIIFTGPLDAYFGYCYGKLPYRSIRFGRAAWAREIAAQVMLARESEVPLEGICFYPIIDRTDWEDSNHWHNCGLWDLRRNSEGRLERVICPEFESELSRIMHRR